MPKLAVLGGGSFGTALAHIIASGGGDVLLWVRDESRAREIQTLRENKRYLPGFRLSDRVEVTSCLSQALNVDLLFIAVPSAAFAQLVQSIQPELKANTYVVSTTKGIDPTDFSLMSQILERRLPSHAIGVLSGPNFAKEMIAGHVTGSVIASENQELIEQVQQVLSSPTFRVYSNDDRYGVELAGALKNIYAIIVGLAQARKCGHNTLAMIMTRSLAEIGRFAHQLGAKPITLLGLAGVGDLILTCGSNLSRNYRLGYALGQGKTYEQAIAEIGQVVEGVNTLRLVKQKADELGIYMPLACALYQLMFENCAIEGIIEQLMRNEFAGDVDFAVC